ncbi:hypothetical protein J2W15_003621 [Pseudarthrobacter sulfonivorans]|nr:hypothetical protein [Pseudarthrobacter sulfonivorans]
MCVRQRHAFATVDDVTRAKATRTGASEGTVAKVNVAWAGDERVSGVDLLPSDEITASHSLRNDAKPSAPPLYNAGGGGTVSRGFGSHTAASGSTRLPQDLGGNRLESVVEAGLGPARLPPGGFRCLGTGVHIDQRRWSASQYQWAAKPCRGRPGRCRNRRKRIQDHSGLAVALRQRTATGGTRTGTVARGGASCCSARRAWHPYSRSPAPTA